MIRVLAVSSSAGLLGAARSFELLVQNVDSSAWNLLVVCPSQGPLVDQLTGAHIPVTVLAKDPDITDACLDGTAFQLSPRLPMRMAHRVKYMADLMGVVRQEHIDLVYLNTIKNASSAMAAKLMRIPVVWHIREPAWDFSGVRKLRLYTLKLIADRVIVVSQYNRQLMMSLGISAEKLVTIHNGVDLNCFTVVQQRDPILANDLGIAPDEMVVGMIGVWSKHKGAMQFLQVVRRLTAEYTKLKFIMVGGAIESDGEYGAMIENLLPEFGTKVLAVGNQRDVRPYLGMMDIFVMPSLVESFTRVNLEAMAMGKPVVATAVGGTPEAIVDGETGFLVPPNDPAAIADRVRILLENPYLIKQMGQQGRERVSMFFSVDAYAHSIQRVWSSVLNNK